MSAGDCILPEIGSSDYLGRLAREPRGPDDLPLSGSVELTFRCNLRCHHCYVPSPAARPAELDTQAVCGVLDSLAAHGVLMLLFTGGEPLLRADFRTLYQHARSLGLLVTVFTNATLIDDTLADFLAGMPPRRVEVTMYGATPATCARVTGATDAYERFQRGVQRLLDRRIPLHLKTMALRANAHELPSMRQWAEARAIPFRFDGVVNPRLDGDRAPLAERVAPDDLSALLDLGAVPSETGTDSRLFRCGAGARTFHVDPAGQVHPCLMWRVEPYDLLRGSVREWNERMAELRLRHAPPGSRCRDCPRRVACPTCAAASRLETGAAGAPVPYLCHACGLPDPDAAAAPPQMADKP